MFKVNNKKDQNDVNVIVCYLVLFVSLLFVIYC